MTEPKYFVRIDRTTIKKNPEWIDGSPNDQVMVPGCPRDVADKDGNVIGQEYSMVRYYTIGPCRPKWLYAHKPCEVECEFCHERFDADELEYANDCPLDEDGNESFFETNRQCPKCGAWNCCDVKWEKLSDGMVKDCG